MTVVLTTTEKPRTGHVYDDRTGTSYEYPSGRYERWIQTGERFLYHRPRVGYTGAGVIGEIQASETPGHLVCEILDHVEFQEPVPLKSPTGDYYELDPTYWSTGRVYWGQGVRPISSARLEAVVTQAGAQSPKRVQRNGGYAAPATAQAIEAYSMQIAMREVRDEFPECRVERMPHNNPGFDIKVLTDTTVVRYVEVKGTSAREPIFFISEGERRFSEANEDRYTLLVVVGINLAGSTHSHVERQAGPITSETADLSPVQWRGQLHPQVS